MKLFSQKLAPARLALFALLACAAGCEESENPPPADFQLVTDRIEIGAQADIHSVRYTVEHPVPGARAEASSDQAWVHSFNTETEGSIVFEVDENPDDTPREATVSVVYAKTGHSFKVVQAAADRPGFGISVDPDATTEASVTYTVVPDDPEMYYLSMVVEKAKFDSFDSDEAYFQDDLSFFRSVAEGRELTLPEYLATILKQGELTAPVHRLVPDTPYYAYVYGLTPDGERTSDIYKQEFRTRKVEPVDVAFDLSFQVMGANVRMQVDPGSYDGYYMFDMIEASGSADPDALVEMMQEHIDNYLEIYEIMGVTPEEAVTRFASRGADSFLYDEETNIKPETNYLGFAMAITPLGRIRSVPVTETVRTGSAGAGDEALAITIGEITTESVVVSVKSAIDDHYVVGITPSVVWEGMDDEEILATLTDGYQWQARGATGDYTTTFYGLQPKNSYSVFAFGYVDGVATTKLFRADFTAAEGDVADISFALRYDKYFDGTEMAELYPEDFAQAQGRAVLPFRIESEGDELYEVYYEAYLGDLSDPELYPDSQLLSELLEIGLWDMEGIFLFSYDYTYTVVGFSVNMNQEFGPIYRQVITLDRAGASPASEYDYGKAPRPAPAAGRTPAPVGTYPTTLDRLFPATGLPHEGPAPELLRPLVRPDGTPSLRQPEGIPGRWTKTARRFPVAG